MRIDSDHIIIVCIVGYLIIKLFVQRRNMLSKREILNLVFFIYAVFVAAITLFPVELPPEQIFSYDVCNINMQPLDSLR